MKDIRTALDKAQNTNAYIYNYGFIWIGWILVRKKFPTSYYFDNNCITNELFYSTKVSYLCFAISKKRAFNKIQKWYNKH